ncbi:hypothetical protein GCM10009771_13340 [Nesterenkonia flava]
MDVHDVGVLISVGGPEEPEIDPREFVPDDLVDIADLRSGRTVPHQNAKWARIGIRARGSREHATTILG